MKKVCIMTSYHPVFDRRIFHRQALTIRNNGYQVVLIAPAEEDFVAEDIQIRAIPVPKSRLRKAKNHTLILKKALKEDADIYHFHDPDLLWVGFVLQHFHRKSVVYDAHEDYAHAALGEREYIPEPLRLVVSKAVDITERFFARRLAAVIAVDEHRVDEIGHPDKPRILIKNYPLAETFKEVDLNKKDFKRLIHLGTLQEVRGQNVLLQLMQKLESVDKDIVLDVVGGFFSKKEESDFLRKLNQMNLTNLNFVGWIPYQEVTSYLERASIGLIPWLPIKKYLNAGNPTKIFEYMASSVVTVASNFGIFRRIFQDSDAGVLFDPLNIDQLVAAITQLVNNPEDLKIKMKNARRLYEKEYNWDIEAAKLLQMYSTLLRIG